MLDAKGTVGNLFESIHPAVRPLRDPSFAIRHFRFRTTCQAAPRLLRFLAVAGRFGNCGSSLEEAAAEVLLERSPT